MTSTLTDYGWTPACREQLAASAPDGTAPARVVAASHGLYRLQGEDGPVDGVLAGALRHHAEGAAELPAVGDWVAVSRPAPDAPALIEAVLPRRSKLSRKVPGARAVEQILAANVDVVFLVMGLDADFSPRRLERFLVQVAESGARPVVVLNKADLPVDVAGLCREAEAVAGGAPVLVVSALGDELGPDPGPGSDGGPDRGPAGLLAHLGPGVTGVLVGSSGVGKSTLTNRLLGREAFATGAVRSRDGRGQHTTSHRELVRLPGGGLLIDGPGIREVQLWADEGVGEAFPEIERLAADCRFRDCRHEGEPGCAVGEAIARGALDADRLESYRALEREAAALARRRDVREKRAAGRRLGRMYKRILEDKRRERGD